MAGVVERALCGGERGAETEEKGEIEREIVTWSNCVEKPPPEPNCDDAISP